MLTLYATHAYGLREVSRQLHRDGALAREVDAYLKSTNNVVPDLGHEKTDVSAVF
jgi:uncharacterized protein (DUF2132 family)